MANPKDEIVRQGLDKLNDGDRGIIHNNFNDSTEGLIVDERNGAVVDPSMTTAPAAKSEAAPANKSRAK